MTEYDTPVCMVVGWVAAVPIVGPVVGYGIYSGFRYCGAAFPPSVIVGGLVGVILTIFVVIGACLVYSDYLKEQKDGKTRKRARDLLLQLLDAEQRSQYKSGIPITVKLADGGFAMIGDSIAGIDWNTRASRGFQCVNVSGQLCKEDDLIAKLLWLRTNPQGLAAVSHIRLY